MPRRSCWRVQFSLNDRCAGCRRANVSWIKLWWPLSFYIIWCLTRCFLRWHELSWSGVCVIMSSWSCLVHWDSDMLEQEMEKNKKTLDGSEISLQLNSESETERGQTAQNRNTFHNVDKVPYMWEINASQHGDWNKMRQRDLYICNNSHILISTSHPISWSLYGARWASDSFPASERACEQKRCQPYSMYWHISHESIQLWGDEETHQGGKLISAEACRRLTAN